MKCLLIDYRNTRGEVVLFCIHCGEYVDEPCLDEDYDEEYEGDET